MHREVERAETAGLLSSRRVGRTRLIRAFARFSGIEQVFIYGSWAARFRGESGQRPVGDIDVLVLGEPGRDALFEAMSPLEAWLGRPVQIAIRGGRWLDTGSGSFHDTVVSRPLVEVHLGSAEDVTRERY